MATAPTTTAPATQGIRFARPPRRSISRVPVACKTAPAPRKSRPLNIAWLTTCKSAPESPEWRSREHLN